jgi:hypothetical protein
MQASLDPSVRSLAFLPSAHVAAAPVELDAVVLTRDDGRFHLDVVPARRVRDLDDEGLALIALRELGLEPFTVTAEDLKAEPRCGNCRLVWSHNRRLVRECASCRRCATTDRWSSGDCWKSSAPTATPRPR